MGFRKFIGCLVDVALEPHRERMALLAPGIEAARIICDSFHHELDRGALQKILYLCEMNERGHTNGQSGIVGKLGFAATDLGPLCSAIDDHLRARNSKSIRNFGVVPPHRFSDETAARIREICQAIQFGFEKSDRRMFNGYVVSISHWERGAWAKRYIPGCAERISVADMLEDFVNRRSARKAAA